MIHRVLKALLVLPGFFLIYFREMIVSNLRIAREALTREDRTNPGFIEIDVAPASDAAVLAYCNLIAMTPGSIPVDLSPDRRKLAVHSMYLDDPEKFRDDLKRNLEDHIRRLSLTKPNV